MPAICDPSHRPDWPALPDAADDDVDRLLTVDDVAALLRVPRSWVYARTRQRGVQRLPFIKLGKYVRFEPAAVRVFLARLRTSA
jgi:excisionase family DNA binding protein